ncbi:LysM domain-containing protein [Chryseobacterium antibioticum]|uniref:LysM domain-containing protein n=1 Tax=Chryseobacterium pyrolae TaxID=2987481 RepID=A0ABT2IE78_9FLAO|nr:LysM domain-containing protein [Chryseobacterium pyrolae]MCT2406924.1 LysM domain-containing protein [Chryseobacterium pyrolae]
MEYIKYAVQKGDTLFSIAQKQEITIEDLKSFHNRYCGLTNTILGDQIPIHLQYVLIENNPNLGTNNILKLNTKILNKEFEYKINIYQKLIANDRSFVNTNTEMVWKYRILNITPNKIIIDIETVSYEVKNQPANTTNLINFSMLFNYPTERLTLELDKYGRIIEVVNQQEIFERWLSVRNNQLAQYQHEESMKGIFIAGDTEFSDTKKSLQGNVLYLLFFDEIYNKPAAEEYEKGKIDLYSKLFQGTKISFKNKQRIFEDENVRVENGIHFIDDDELELKKKYWVNYKDLVGEDFTYNYNINSEANYNKEKGILINLNAKCVERANEQLFHQTDYTIQLLN